MENPDASQNQTDPNASVVPKDEVKKEDDGAKTVIETKTAPETTEPVIPPLDTTTIDPQTKTFPGDPANQLDGKTAI